MADNPYIPPSANFDKPVFNLSVRPKALWVYYVLAALWCVLLAKGIFATISAFSTGLVAPAQMLIHTSWRLLMLVGMVLSIRQSHQGKKYGRLTGLIFIGIFIAILLIFSVVRVAEIVKTAPDLSSSYVVGSIVGTLFAMALMTAPAVYWLYAFGFSAKAKAYFRIQNK